MYLNTVTRHFQFLLFFGESWFSSQLFKSTNFYQSNFSKIRYFTHCKLEIYSRGSRKIFLSPRNTLLLALEPSQKGLSTLQKQSLKSFLIYLTKQGRNFKKYFPSNFCGFRIKLYHFFLYDTVNIFITTFYTIFIIKIL